jgi:hypothetical protein
MRSYQDHYVHELSVDTILKILKKDAWEVSHQSATSAITNDNDLEEPDSHWMEIKENTAGTNAFSDIQFDPHVKRMLDVGGGRFDCNIRYLKRKRNIELLVWDPYNRSQSHNREVQASVDKHHVDAVTSMSVLNVIPEVETRLAHIHTLKKALVIGEKAYFKIWPGEQPFQGSYLPVITDTYYQANAYADRFLREIEIVFGVGNVKLDDRIPNLIVAVKLSESHTSRSDIAFIQKKSEKEFVRLTIIKEKSMSRLYAKTNNLRLFSTHSSFLKKMEDDFIEKNRHFDSTLQHEYDRRYGLALR